MEKYYALTIEETINSLKTSNNGLTEKKAKELLEKFGPNELRKEKRFELLKLLIRQFSNFLILILLLAVAISFLIGHYIDAMAILAIVVLNGAFGFIQEFKAEKAMHALKKMIALNANVIRNGAELIIDSKQLVPGDLIVLRTGDKVPADARLIEANNLKTGEAALTGESTPVEKSVKTLKEEKAIAEQSNMVFMDSVVTYGRGKAVVTATGMNTEFGKIASLIREMSEEETPLKKRVTEMGKFLGMLIILICAAIFAIGFIAARPLFEMFLISVSLAVAAIPEGLPAVITITLALGMKKMAEHNAVVRRMPAVESLGSATVICSDKTGTLTKNEMTVTKLFANNQEIDVTGEGYGCHGNFLLNGKKIDPKNDKTLSMLLKIAQLCNDSVLSRKEATCKIIGDPTEASLVVLAEKAGLKFREERINEIQFDSKRKMMSTIHLTGKEKFVYSKGALEEVLKKSKFILEKGKIIKLTETKRKKLIEVNKKFAGNALRVLALAFKKLGEEEIEKNLIFAGLVAMIDPPREEAKAAIASCKQAGIKVVMLTGDNAATAKAIAKKINLIDSKDEILTGNDLNELSDADLRKKIYEVKVFARINPEHKLRIVNAFKEKGEIVAVTGDGVNDAPALKKADVGIAMGINGTDVSKEASDVVLKDDNFATIVVAIKEGRRIYDNIKNFVRFLLSANFAELGLVCFAVLTGFPLPFVPLQILWINLVTDGLPAIALGVEPISSNVMKRKPFNPRKSIFKGMLSFIIVAAVFGILAGLLVFFYAMPFDAANGIDLFDLSQPSKTRTMVFTIAVMFELFLVLNCRSEEKTFLELPLFSNKWLVAGIVSAILLQLMVIYVPFFQVFFRTVALGFFDWFLILVLASSALFVPFALKFVNKVKKVLRLQNNTLSSEIKK